jgi:ADP-ribose pyrophosphatase YjhB (NUDIX family)
VKSDKRGTMQYATLPWRRRGSSVEVMLLTSRETKRWVLPKGWPIVGMQPGLSAAQEALEEAGVEGVLSAAIGRYPYGKRLKDGTERPLEVEVFPLEVRRELETWPEAAERERRWFSLEEAASAVDEPELSRLILEFSAASAPPRT